MMRVKKMERVEMVERRKVKRRREKNRVQEISWNEEESWYSEVLKDQVSQSRADKSSRPGMKMKRRSKERRRIW